MNIQDQTVSVYIILVSQNIGISREKQRILICHVYILERPWLARLIFGILLPYMAMTALAK